MSTTTVSIGKGGSKQLVVRLLGVAVLLLCSNLRSIRFLNSENLYYKDSSVGTADISTAAPTATETTSAATTTVTGGTTATTTMRSDARVRAVDCRTLPVSDHDPNVDLEEDPKRLVDLVKDDARTVVFTPEFWIVLHKKAFDMVRWGPIMKKGVYYEAGITNIFQEILQPSEPKGLVLDVGMNIGWFTLLSRAMGHKVMGFDPNPIMHSRVCSSLAYNGWWDRDETVTTSSDSSGVATYLYGLGDRIGTLEFSVGSNPGGGSLVRFFHENKKVEIKHRWEVPVTTLDHLAEEKGWLAHDGSRRDASPIVHLLKIDVEGYEPFVIRGASKLIRSGIVRNILHENNHSGMNREEALEEIRTLFEDLVDAGYKIHAVTNTGGIITSVYRTIVGPTNLMLRNGTFSGSEIHHRLAEVGANIWWKKLVDEVGPAGESSVESSGNQQQHTLHSSIALWKELEQNHTRLHPNGAFPQRGPKKNTENDKKKLTKKKLAKTAASKT